MSSRIVNFRADGALVDALQGKASAEGISLSELLRRAAESTLDRPGEPAMEAPNYAKLACAARGDLEALRELAHAGVSQYAEQGDIVALIEGLTFARIAAAIGDANDAGLLLNALLCAADLIEREPAFAGWGHNIQSESLALMSRLADAGVPLADDALVAMSGESTADAAVAARVIAGVMPLAGGNL